jgi:hypothetical protein
MRQITSDLQAVQRVRSPRARVTCTVEARGQNAVAPALAWAELVPNVGQTVFRATTAVGLADGSVLKFVGNIGALQKYVIADPTLAASWTGASATTLVASTVLSVAAVRVPGTSTIRLFYINASNNVQYIESADNGSTWGAAVTVYSGGAAVLDLVVGYVAAAADGPWLFGFTSQSGADYTANFGYYNGVSWVVTAYAVNWRAGGIDAVSGGTVQWLLVTRQRSNGASKIRRLRKSGVTYLSAEEIDQTQAGLFGLEISYCRFFHLPEAGACMGIVGEAGYGAGCFLGVAGIMYEGNYLVDEPIMMPSIAAVVSQPYACLCSVGADLYLVGDTVVWRGAAQAATAETLTPIQYVYDDHQLEIEFQAGIPALYVGQILVVNRTLSFGAQSGSEVFRAIIVRVEQGTDLVKVVALDALGWLGSARCRRPSILNDGSAAGVLVVMRRLAGRFGIAVGSDNTALETALVMPFTLAPAESLRGAAFRVGSQSEWYLVPANDGSFKLTMIVPGSSVSGDYADVAHSYGAAPSEQPVDKAAVISDYRSLAFSYVLGSYSTDPQDGGAVAMARGPVVDNTRPLSYSLTNSRYNTTARVAAAATSEAARQKKLPVTARMEGQANLALEVYDVVAVTEVRLGWAAKQFRVRRIDERWKQGRLWQVVYLGSV